MGASLASDSNETATRRMSFGTIPAEAGSGVIGVAIASDRSKSISAFRLATGAVVTGRDMLSVAQTIGKAAAEQNGAK